MSLKKRRHHYVWRYYLRSWAKDEKIWCKRDTSVFHTNLVNVAQMRDFYKIYELTETEYEFLTGLTEYKSHELQKELNKFWVDIAARVTRVRKTGKKLGINTPEFHGDIDTYLTNSGEEIQTKIEEIGLQFLQCMNARDLSFYLDEHKCVDFMLFISVQYVRTNTIKSNLLAREALPKSIDFDAVWAIAQYILATNMSLSLYMDRREYQLVLIENRTDVPFITTDQPLINLRDTHSSKTDEVKELEIYYPLSPTLAMLLSQAPSVSLQPNTTEVVKLNSLMVEKANQQIFGPSEESISHFDLRKNA